MLIASVDVLLNALLDLADLLQRAIPTSRRPLIGFQDRSPHIASAPDEPRTGRLPIHAFSTASC